MFKKIKSLDLPTRLTILAIFYSVFWISLHWFFTQPKMQVAWMAPQLLISVLTFIALNSFWVSFNSYRFGIWAQRFLALLYFQPFFQLQYFQTYHTFLEQQNLSLLLREPMFLLNVFAKEATVFQFVLIVLGCGLMDWLNRQFLFSENSQINNFSEKKSTETKKQNVDYKKHPYFLFGSKWIWLFLILTVGSQIKWCLKHDTSQLIMRPFYPIVIIAIVSILISIFKSSRPRTRKIFWMTALIANVFQLYALNLHFPEFKDHMSMDSRFYRALFGAYFVNTALNTLDQTDQAQEKFIALPTAKMDYNILLILDDSQRWDFSNQHGYPTPTDEKIKSFLQKSYDFRFPISPANFTDTSVPAILSGMGSNQDVLKLKGSLVFWDYFSKGVETFFMSTQPLGWSRLDLFYQSIGQKHLWGAVAHSDFKGNPETVDDRYVIKHFNEYLHDNNKKNIIGKNFVGVIQTFSSHYPYNSLPDVTAPYKPCDLTRSTGVESFKNCYLNGQIASAATKEQLLKSVDLEKTIVIMTSDHGEGMNEHGIWFHGVDYHQEMVKVPLFIYIPDNIKQKIPTDLLANLQKNTEKVVSVMDVLPTVLDLHQVLSRQDLKPKDTTFSGRSLLRPWDYRVVFSSHCFPQYRCYSREIAFIDDDYFVLYRPSEGFFKIYSTFGDLNQTNPLDWHTLLKEPGTHEKLKRLVEQAAEEHSIGQSMKAYFESLKK